MEKKKTPQQIAVLITLAVSLLLVCSGWIYRNVASSQPVPIMVADGHPRIGSSHARVGLLLIEDFRCAGCRTFIEEVFPAIREKYIDTGLAYCILVPVAFLDGSKPLANAALAVYKIAPKRFFAYVHAIFQHFGTREIHGSERVELLKLAEQVGGIDVEPLKKCIETNCHFTDLDRNFDWAERIMGKDFAVPTLYVNGIPTLTNSVEAVSSRIDKVLVGMQARDLERKKNKERALSHQNRIGISCL